MSKNWEVELHYVVVVAVQGCETEDEAFQFAQDEVSMSMSEAMTDGMAKVVPDEEWESTVRHAHFVNRPD